MKIINLTYFLENKEKFKKLLLEWKTIIYPTDTIYWIWWVWNLCLEKIYDIKQRPQNKKVSIILPAKNIDNFIEKIQNISENRINQKIIDKIKNYYKNKIWFTVIIKAKESFFSNLDNFWKAVYKDKSIWIRFLNHPFQDFVNHLGTEFITSSANISGSKVITSLDKLDKQIKEKVDFWIDWWILEKSASTIINSTNWEILSR